MALRLIVGQAVLAVDHAPAGLVDQFDQRGHVLSRPGSRHQLLSGRCGIGRLADELDHRIEVGDGDCQTDQDVGPLSRLAELVAPYAG